MCGRYGMFLEDNPTLERIAGQAQKNSPNLELDYPPKNRQ